jgi:hypothetical protein
MSRLFIDEQLVLNSWQTRLVQTTKTAHLALQAGYHSIHLEYFSGGGVPTLSVSWANSTMPLQEIPASALFQAAVN